MLLNEQAYLSFQIVKLRQVRRTLQFSALDSEQTRRRHRNDKLMLKFESDSDFKI